MVISVTRWPNQNANSMTREAFRQADRVDRAHFAEETTLTGP